MHNLYKLECLFIKHGDCMNINIGVPYEAIINKAIRKGYAGNQTEVIRQALLAYERELEQEEVMLVGKGIELEMQEIRSGKLKTKSIEQLKKKYSRG